MQQQLEAAVSQAVAATQERVQQFLDAANASRAAAEADVIELRQALAGRDETLATLQQQLAEQQQQQPAAVAAGSSGGGAAGVQVLQQQVAGLQQQLDGLRRELAAAHQRTHEVTQMYLSAASAAAAPPPPPAAAPISSSSSKFLPPLPGMSRGLGGAAGGRVQGPKGLLGLYKRPQVRGLFVMYFVAVHAAVSAIVVRAT